MIYVGLWCEWYNSQNAKKVFVTKKLGLMNDAFRVNLFRSREGFPFSPFNKKSIWHVIMKECVVCLVSLNQPLLSLWSQLNGSKWLLHKTNNGMIMLLLRPKNVLMLLRWCVDFSFFSPKLSSLLAFYHNRFNITINGALSKTITNYPFPPFRKRTDYLCTIIRRTNNYWWQMTKEWYTTWFSQNTFFKSKCTFPLYCIVC